LLQEKFRRAQRRYWDLRRLADLGLGLLKRDGVRHQRPCTLDGRINRLAALLLVRCSTSRRKRPGQASVLMARSLAE
jgi:hypothetical protein